MLDPEIGSALEKVTTVPSTPRTEAGLSPKTRKEGPIAKTLQASDSHSGDIPASTDALSSKAFSA